MRQLASFMKKVEEFARSKKFADAKANYPKVDPATVRFLSQILGIAPEVLRRWKLDPDSKNGTDYLTSLLKDKDLTVGVYDGRVTAKDSGIAGTVDKNDQTGANDPTMTAVGGVYTAMWNTYLNEELKYTSTSPFLDLNDKINWNFDHVDPTGKKQKGWQELHTTGDLAASMELNPYLKVFSANGYYDARTPFFQTKLDLENLPLGNKNNRDKLPPNLVFHTYRSGHMIYLDKDSRKEMKKDLGTFYDRTLEHRTAEIAIRPEDRKIRYRRRFNRTPY
jgi:carboxypeptidase C (cathepsin A)